VVQIDDSDLPARLELTFRLLGKRIYAPSVRQLRSLGPGLDRASIVLLAALEERDDLRPSDIATAVELDLSTVSRQLSRLEHLGLVSRRPDGEDGRARRISLTEAGRSELATVRLNRAAALDEVFGHWPDADRGELLRLLDELLRSLTALPSATSPSIATTSPNAENPR
jgi:DNA-binding MarR family transcriptional regulator